MAWSGGTFSRTNGVNSGSQTWQDDRDAGTKIRADRHDTHDQDLADGINSTLHKGGQNTPTADLPMGSQKHTGVGDATARDHYAAANQVADDDFNFCAAAAVAGTGDAIALTPAPAFTAYAAGMRVSFVAEASNTGAVTVNVNALGARAVQKLGAALVAGDITTGDAVELRHDGTQFQMTSPARDPVLTAGVIATADLANGAVATAKIADDAVSLAKMAGGTAGNLITYDASGDPAAVAAGTAGQVLRSNGAGNAPTMQDDISLDSEQPSTSGTSVNFTGISSSAKRITIMFEEVSTNGSDDLLIQIGDSGGLETAGYVSTTAQIDVSPIIVSSTSGFVVSKGTAAAAVSGHMVLTNISDGDGLTWVSSHSTREDGTRVSCGGGTKTLSARLDRLSLVPTGADTFDNGSINILVE